MGGTGILVFLDLVAYLVRRFLALESKELRVFKDEDFPDLTNDFELVMYATAPRRSESIGIELCEGAARIFEKMGDNLRSFRFIPIFSREAGERLNETSIDRIVGANARDGRLKKVWVCGPPKMNETFERELESIAPKYKLKKEDYEVF